MSLFAVRHNDSLWTIAFLSNANEQHEQEQTGVQTTTSSQLFVRCPSFCNQGKAIWNCGTCRKMKKTQVKITWHHFVCVLNALTHMVKQSRFNLAQAVVWHGKSFVVPDNHTHPSGNWLIMFKSGKIMVRRNTSYANCRKLDWQFLRLKRWRSWLLDNQGTGLTIADSSVH